MQLSVLASELRKSIGSPTTADVPELNLYGHLNAAYRDIAAKYRFHKARKMCSFPTVVGTTDYGLPTDAEALFRVRDKTNGKKLGKIGDREYSERFPALASITNGKPEVYSRHRNFISILTKTGGAPDGVYTIEIFYRVGIVDMSVATDVPVLPESWHRGIRLLARWYYYDVEKGDIPKASAAFASWRVWVTDKPSEIDEESVDIDSGVALPTLANDTRSRRRTHTDLGDEFGKTD